MTLPKILALDLATNTGYALGAPGARPSSGVHRIGRPHDTLGAFADDFERWLGTVIERLRPSVIYYEAPIMAAGVTTPETAIKLQGLAYHVNLLAYRARVRCRPAHMQTVRVHFCGKGRAERKTIKGLIEDACRRRGWKPGDDNEADALALWDWACFREAPDIMRAHALDGMGSAAA